MLEDHRVEEKAPKQLLKDQVSFDLERYLNFFPNKSFALRNLSKETGLNEKTLRRLLNKENIPSNQTLFKIYYVFTGANNEKELLESSPQSVRRQLENFESDSYEKSNSLNLDFLSLIENEPIISEIYLLLAVKKVDLAHIIYHYGQLGGRAVEKLEQLGLAQKVDNNTYTLAKKQPYLSEPILKALGLRMTKTFMKAEEAMVEGKNFIGLYAVALNEKGRKRWLEIEQRSFNEKMAVANDPENQGQLPLFTFQVTDDFEAPTRTLQ